MDQLIPQLKNNRMAYKIKMDLIMNTPGLDGDDFLYITEALGYKRGFARYLARDYYLHGYKKHYHDIDDVY
jgi:hypothetical protein